MVHFFVVHFSVVPFFSRWGSRSIAQYFNMGSKMKRDAEWHDETDACIELVLKLYWQRVRTRALRVGKIALFVRRLFEEHYRPGNDGAKRCVKKSRNPYLLRPGSLKEKFFLFLVGGEPEKKNVASVQFCRSHMSARKSERAGQASQTREAPTTDSRHVRCERWLVHLRAPLYRNVAGTFRTNDSNLAVGQESARARGARPQPSA